MEERTLIRSTDNIERKVTPKELIYKYVGYIPFVIICLALSISTAVIYIRYQTPIYYSSISVLFENVSKGGSTVSSLDMLDDVVLYKKSINLTSETQMLRTTTLMSRVIKRLGLNIQIIKEGEVKKSELYKNTPIILKVLSVKDSSQYSQVVISKKAGQLYLLNNNTTEKLNSDQIVQTPSLSFQIFADTSKMIEKDKYIINWIPTENLASSYSSQLNIRQPSRDANILEISMTSEEPEKGKEILNTLIAEYNNTNIEQKNRIVDNTINFIDERVGLLSGELGKVEGGLENFKQANQIVEPATQTGMSLGDQNSTINKIESNELKLQVIDMVRKTVANPASRYKPIPTTLGLDDPTLTSLVQQYNNNQFQREELLKTMPAANPAVKTIENQIEKIGATIVSNLDNIVVNTNQLNKKYQTDLREYNSKLNVIPRHERQLLEISRQQSIKEKLFMFLLQKREEAAITRATPVGKSIPLDPAKSLGIISPITSNIYRTAILLGLLIPCLLVFLKDILNDKIIAKYDITKNTKIPIIGEIVHSDDKNLYLPQPDDRSLLSEQFRTVRSNLPFFMNGEGKMSILMTSTMPGDGKTFCALNLGAVYANSGKKTIIVELDLRKPKISKLLQVGKASKGVTNYITGDCEVNEIINSIPNFQNLFFIPAGVIPPNPSDLILSSKIDSLFANLKKEFDMIIIDSPPAALVSDAQNLSRIANTTIYVLRQRVTPIKQLQELTDKYNSGIFPNLSLLVNDIKIKGANSYFGYWERYMQNYRYYGQDYKKGLF